MKISPKAITSLEALLAKTVPNGDCLEWGGWKTHTAPHYGVLEVHGVQWRAHRYAYTLANGDIPSGFCVMHTCDNPACINPAHLRVGTWAENNRDRAQKGRSANTHGERHPSTKLTDDQVRKIKQIQAAGTHTHKQVGEMFGVSHHVVAQIKRGKNWRSISVGGDS